MLGKRIAELRKSKGISQYEMAKRLGFSRGKLANYEQGSRQPDYETLQHIADFFDVTTDYLLGRTENPYPVNKDEEERTLDHYKNKIATEFPDIDLMFKDMESLTAEDMKEVYEYIKFKMSQKKDK